MTNKDVELLIGQVDTKKQNGLTLPRGYSVSNAMNAAYLMLKDAEDKNGNKVLEVCSRESVANALMQMATQGLNPVKKQCYFVAYGNKCTLVPSYFGTLAILNRVENLVCQPVANVIYEGDAFELGYDLDTGEKKILKHETSWKMLGGKGKHGSLQRRRGISPKHTANLPKKWQRKRC